MTVQPRHTHPPGKTKTALRRGHSTPGHPAAVEKSAPRVNTATTLAEQALLFAEAAAEEPAPQNRTVD